jgi:hypothetical protein
VQFYWAALRAPLVHSAHTRNHSERTGAAHASFLHEQKWVPTEFPQKSVIIHVRSLTALMESRSTAHSLWELKYACKCNNGRWVKIIEKRQWTMKAFSRNPFFFKFLAQYVMVLMKIW